MTEHERLMLCRHLNAAVRHYGSMAEQLREDGHHAMAEEYLLAAADAKVVHDRVVVGMVSYARHS